MKKEIVVLAIFLMVFWLSGCTHTVALHNRDYVNEINNPQEELPRMEVKSSELTRIMFRESKVDAEQTAEIARNRNVLVDMKEEVVGLKDEVTDLKNAIKGLAQVMQNKNQSTTSGQARHSTMTEFIVWELADWILFIQEHANQLPPNANMDMGKEQHSLPI